MGLGQGGSYLSLVLTRTKNSYTDQTLVQACQYFFNNHFQTISNTFLTILLFISIANNFELRVLRLNLFECGKCHSYSTSWKFAKKNGFCEFSLQNFFAST